MVCDGCRRLNFRVYPVTRSGTVHKTWEMGSVWNYARRETVIEGHMQPCEFHQTFQDSHMQASPSQSSLLTVHPTRWLRPPTSFAFNPGKIESRCSNCGRHAPRGAGARLGASSQFSPFTSSLLCVYILLFLSCRWSPLMPCHGDIGCAHQAGR